MPEPITIYEDHVLDRLRELPDRSVHLIITSPPYYGLRDYDVPQSVWGGDVACAHAWDTQHATCTNCGAWRGSLGQEPTLDLYVAHLTMVFHEARRVLRADGNLLLNLGDSYAGSWGNYGTREGNQRSQHVGLKNKDLMGVPWRVALALQADSWILRNDIPWLKANVMPEPVKDRHTRAHEYFFHFTKQQRSYWDRHAIMAQASEESLRRIQESTFDTQTGGDKDYAASGVSGHRSARHTLENFAKNPQRNARTTDMYAESLDLAIAEMRAYLAHLEDVQQHGGLLLDPAGNPLAIFCTTESYAGAHFATFPPQLIVPLIRAASPVDGIVLDPFFGAGTTGVVCKQLMRSCIGIEISAAYTAMARERIANERDPVVVSIPARGSVIVPGGKRRKAVPVGVTQTRLFEVEP